MSVCRHGVCNMVDGEVSEGICCVLIFPIAEGLVGEGCIFESCVEQFVSCTL